MLVLAVLAVWCSGFKVQRQVLEVLFLPLAVVVAVAHSAVVLTQTPQ
jgi:hypothetical protein